MRLPFKGAGLTSQERAIARFAFIFGMTSAAAIQNRAMGMSRWARHFAGMSRSALKDIAVIAMEKESGKGP